MSVQISTEVLAVLSTLSTDGLNARIEQQLDRKLYTKVNQVLEACGGKWNRKAKAHVFPSSAELILDQVMVTGEVETRQDIGFFPTPTALAKRLVEMAGIKSGTSVLEPSAGTGRIVEALLAVGAKVTICERDVRMKADLLDKVRCLGKVVDYLSQNDFMDVPVSARFDHVAMNPPFCRVGLGDHLDHVRHAFNMLKSGGTLVSVLPAGVEFRQDKRHKEFRTWVANHGTIESLPEDSFKESGTSVRTCVIRLDA